jgi:hypothetical protein
LQGEIVARVVGQKQQTSKPNGADWDPLGKSNKNTLNHQIIDSIYFVMFQQHDK